MLTPTKYVPHTPIMRRIDIPSARYGGWNWCSICRATVDAPFTKLHVGEEVVCGGCSTTYVFDREEDSGAYVLLPEAS